MAMSREGRYDDGDVPFRFRTTIDVRFRDLDALGHVNNAVYFTYFEVARGAYLTAVHGRPHGLEDLAIVIAEATCRYRSPAFYNERLIVEVAAVALRSRSFTLRYRVVEEATGRLVAEGRSVQVAYDHRAKHTMALPAAFRAQLEAFEGRTIGAH
jgi:acyl-CoA thioester hydrolase